MAWQDRLQEAAYNSPSGLRVRLNYENVRRSFEKKTTAFEFPDVDGSYIQDNGHTGRHFPLRVFFWGENYDLEAEIFDAVLRERGIGKLEHPIYGTVDVVPFGTITQRDDLKTAANQAIFEVEFWATIGLIYPSSQTDPASEVIAAIEAYNAASAEDYGAVIETGTAIQRVTLENQNLNLVATVATALRDIAATDDGVEQQFNAIVDSINRGIDVLVSEPVTLAFQASQMIQSPSRALTDILARLDGYGNLLNSLISGSGAAADNNTFRTSDLYASGYVTGSILSTVNNQFVTKRNAIAAAEQVFDQFNALVVWRDDSFAALNEIDTGAAYQKLQEAVALTAGFLVEISFSLKQERRLVLTRARTTIDLVGELYGTIDDELDFFIQSNDLSGDEINELPAGREIVYYV